MPGKLTTASNLARFSGSGLLIPSVHSDEDCNNGHLCKILFDHNEDAMFICELKPDGLSGKILEVNETACKRLGYSREELLQLQNSNIEDSSHVPDKDKLAQQYLCDKKIEFESYHRTKSGTLIPVKLFIRAIDFKGTPASLTVAHDITARKQAEISEKLYQAIVEDQTEAICRFRPDGTFTFINDAYCRMYNKQPSELIGANVLSLIPAEIREKTAAHLKKLTPDRPTATIEEYRFAPDGQICWVEFTDRAIFDNTGKLVEIQSIGRDITEKKQLEQELRRHHNRLEELVCQRTKELADAYVKLQREIADRKRAEDELYHFFQLSADILCIMDFKGRFRRVNPAFYKLLGYTAEELQALHPKQLIHPDDVASTLKVAAKLAAGSAVLCYENRYRCRDGSYKWLSWTAVPRLSEGVIYAVARNITERNQLEQEMARLDRLNLVGQIAASIGHEVRNPMTTVRGFLQMLQRKNQTDGNDSYYSLMIEELDRANAIITEFLTLAKNKIVDRKTQNLNRIITSLLPLIQADVYEHDQNIRLDFHTIPDLLLDEKEIRQLLLNLVRNGIEASEPHKEIVISTYQQAGEVVLVIQDQGSGIAPEIIDKLGTPFLTTKESGTGLGLAVCFSIAARHNASITVEPQPVGTRVAVRFKMGE